jgi:hypothetical protein
MPGDRASRLLLMGWRCYVGYGTGSSLLTLFHEAR